MRQEAVVEVQDTDRDAAPVVGVDVPVELPTLADGSPMPVPGAHETREQR